MSRREDIIILGRGGHARCVINIIEDQDKYNILGITDVNPEADSTFLGYPILGGDDVLKSYLENGVQNVAIGVGGFTDNVGRSRLFQKVKELGFTLPPIIHPTAVVTKRTTIGEGALIFPGVVLDEASIGANNMVGTASSVDHGSVLGDHVFISAGVTIGANTTVGDHAFFALGCKVISGISIESKILVGAGAVVVNDLKDEGTYIGCPAKKMF